MIYSKIRCWPKECLRFRDARFAFPVAFRGEHMGVTGYEDLRSHIGHKVAVVSYGRAGQDPHNVAIECEDCGEVLLDFDHPGVVQEKKALARKKKR